jgi:hypothetical protein
MTAKHLAYLLLRYDLDAPYGPGEAPPPLSEAEFLRYSTIEHGGDCTHTASPCARCHAEYWIKVAEWVLSQS